LIITNLDSLPVMQQVPSFGKDAYAVERGKVTTSSGATVEVYVLGIIRKYDSGAAQQTVVVCARAEHTDVCDTGLVNLTSQLYTCPIREIKKYDRIELFKKRKPIDHYVPSALKK